MSEIVDSFEVKGRLCEVFVSADAAYDEAKSQLVVQLDGALRPASGQTPGGPASRDLRHWQETVTESVSAGQATEVARDIFHRWVRQVRQRLPDKTNLQPA